MKKVIKQSTVFFSLILILNSCTKKTDENTLLNGTAVKSYHVKMGTQGNPSIPRCLCITSGVLYDMTSAAANCSNIDFISGMYVSSEPYFKSPANDNDVASTWSRRKSTGFYSQEITSIDQSAFDNIKYSSQVASYCKSYPPTSNTFYGGGGVGTGIGDVFTVQTYENKQAIIRITNRQGSINDSQGFFEFDVKVAQ